MDSSARLDHAGVVVSDLPAAVAFFTEHLGASEVFRLDRVGDPSGTSARRLGAPGTASFALAMLSLDGGRLELVQWWDGAAEPAHVTAVGSAHVAVEVPDVPRALARLRTVSGVEVVGEPVRFGSGPTPGLTNAFLATSFGVLVELVGWGHGRAPAPGED